MRKLSRCLILFGGLLCGVTAFGQPGGVVLVSHIPVVFAEIGRPVVIKATLDGDVSIDQVIEANIWYRNRDQETYDFVELEPGVEDFKGEIPGEHITAVGIEYYLEFTFNDDSKITFPSAYAQSNPVIVSVRGAGPEAGESAVMVISPEPESMFPEEEILVAASFDQTVRTIEPSKVILRIDGRDRTREAMITEDVLTAVFDKFRPGRHRIDILVKEATGPVVLDTWFFTVRSDQAKRRARTGIRQNIRGSVEFQGRALRSLGIEQQIARENISVRGKWGDFTALAVARLTSEEQGSLQPQHRFKVAIGQRWWKIRGGDINPRYNELVLYGRRVRGAEINLLSDHFNMHFVSGQTARTIEGRHLSTTVDIQVDSTVTPYDTTYVSTDIYSTSTFRRNLHALRFTFGSPDKLMFGMMAMKAKDDRESLDSTHSLYSSKPKDNLVNGYSVEGFFHGRRISLKGEAAISLYNGNTLEPPIADAEDFKNIIWINTYFEPLPDKGLPSGTSDLDGGEIFKSILRNALSVQGRLRMRYYNNDLSVGYRKINVSYNSLGSPSLYNNDAGWWVRDRIRLFNSRLYLNLGYQSFHDNLKNLEDTNTMYRNHLNVGFSVFTGESYPDLNVSFRNQLNENDGNLITTDMDTTLIQDSDTRISNMTNMVNVGLNHNLYFAGTKNNLNLGVMTSVRDDEYNETGASEQLVLSLGMSTEYDFPLVTRLNIYNAMQTGMGGLTDVNYMTINVRGDYKFLNNTLIPYFGPRITLGTGENILSPEPPGLAADNALTVHRQLLDFTRIDWITGIEYRFMKDHSLATYVSMTTYMENSQFEYWNGERFDVTEEVIDNDGQRITQPQFDREDYYLTLVYTYRF